MNVNQHTYDEPIAIIGVACKLPGDISNLEDLWNVVINKKDALTSFPENRINNINALVNNKRTKGKIVTKKGGFLNDIEYFDANFFQISAKEAEKLDPQQRLLLETSFNAVEDAGIPLEKLYGSKTGVFIGCWLNDFEHKLAQTPHDVDVYSTTGSGRYPLSGRLSFFYNLQGPSITVDTACSSSLVAMHLAMQSLKSKECNVAFAGAANTIIDSFISVGYSRSGLLSEYGACHFGSNNPDGYVRSEGAAVVILKRLSDAIKDNNQIYAVLPASVCNNDGASDKYMLAPSSITQQIMIEEAYKKANIDTNKVQYIEAHGTGTKAGDPSEINAIWNALSKNNRTIDNNIFVGSIKTNIGHTESVAGFAGLFKTLMAMKHKTIPPNLHFYEPNTDIAWENIGIKIPTEAITWNANEDNTLIAGINAFGITGTNAHIIVQSFDSNKNQEVDITQPKTKIFPISANHQEALISYAKKYIEILDVNNYNNIINNVCFHKSNLKQRKAIVFSEFNELVEALKNIAERKEDIAVLDGYAEIQQRKIAFVFPGQGSQWQKMGKELYQHQPIFKKYIDACEIEFLKFTDWKLTEKLFDENDITEIDIIQPALVAIEIALAKLWMHLGVQPYAVIGHSMGEVAAAYIADKISLHDAANIICTRSKLMKEQSGKGAMGYIALSADEVQNALDKLQLQNVNIGVVNSPKSTVVTGNKNEIEQIVQYYEQQEIFSRLIKVDVASHSKHMDALKERLKDATKNINTNQSKIIFQSTVHPSQDEQANLDASYWVDNLRNTVQFSSAIEKLIDNGVDTFIEISPNPILSQAIQENIEYKNSDAQYLSSLEKNTDDERNFSKHVAQAYCNGILINWKNLYGNNYEKILLPEYPWQKEYYWIKNSESNLLQQNRIVKGKSAHSFLHEYIFNNNVNTHIWKCNLNLDTFNYLIDHKVNDEILFPAAGFIELIQATCNELFYDKIAEFQHTTIHQPLVLKEEENISVKIILQENIGNLYDCIIVSEQHDEEILHCKSEVLFKENTISTKKLLTISDVNNISHEMHYESCRSINLNYGDNFRGIQSIHYNQSIFEADIDLQIELENYVSHPSLLDACLQSILAPIYLKYNKTFVPYSIEKYTLYKNISKNILKSQVVVKSINDNNCIVDLFIFEDDTCVISAQHVEFKNLSIEQELTEDVWHELIAVEINPTENESRNDVLVVHNNSVAELFYNAFFNNDFDVRYLDINDYSEQAMLKSFRSIGINSNTQIIFCIDALQNINDTSKIIAAQEQTILAIANLVKTITTLNLDIRLWCITQHAIATQKDEVINPLHHQIPAFIRVLWNENNELKPSVIDIQNTEDIIPAIHIIAQQQIENEIAIRNNQFFATRLNQVEKIDNENTQIISANNIPFRASMSSIGVIDNIVFNKINLPNISDDEVLVEIESIGVNFMNLLSVLGICPGKVDGFGTLGIECVGIAKKVGKNIHHIQENDRVYGMAYDTLASHTIVNGNALCKAPNNLSVDELATIPAVFITVYYSLVELARIKKGDKVLIHAATGGVGLAAIQICKLYECEIFATAGSDDKRDYLLSIGVDNVYNSRSTDFYEEILEDTNNYGVDVVLNSLTGAAMYKSLELLTSFGRFIEIGKKDIFENSKIGLEVFKKSLSYFMVDAEKMLFEKPEILGELLQDISVLLEDNQLQPLPSTVFDVCDTKEAFRKLNTSKHIGKIIINFEHKQNLQINDTAQFLVNDKASYLLTGAFGGLGLTYTKMLLELGAKHLILIGRNLPKNDVAKQLDEWRNTYNATLQVEQADVANEAELKNIIQNIHIDFPLKGVFHLAGLLDDAAIINISREKYYNVVTPKILGALHLHQLTKKIDLDYFVLFSSSAVLFSSPGQGAYVAANAFLDALAHDRKLKNLPAISIQWSTIDDVGLAASQKNRAERLKNEGIEPMSSLQSLDYFKKSITTDYSNIGVFKFDVAKWKNNYASAKDNPYFDLLDTQENEVQKETALSFVDTLSTLQDAGIIENSIENKLKETISKVTKITTDNIQTQSTFKSLGIDSLMSIQLKNQLEKVFETKLSVTSFWTYPTIKIYTKFLLDKLEIKNNQPIDNNTQTIEIENQKSSEDNKQQQIIAEEEIIVDSELDELSKLLDDELKNL